MANQTRRVKGPRPKHVPMRTCVVCRTTRPKRELVRIVRTLTGPVVIDLRGKQNGRGAYLCRQQVCWTAAFKRRALEHALQTAVSPEDRAQLEAFARTLPPTLPAPATAPVGDDTVVAATAPPASSNQAPSAR